MKKYTVNQQGFPIVLEPETDNFDLIAWANESRSIIRDLLNTHGAILFRGFSLPDVEKFEEFSAAATSNEWVDYREAATPRVNLNGNVFTSTEYPASETIFFHNENSHTTTWPLYISFYCKTPAESGGETPLADCRKIYRELPTEIRERFENKKVLYIRNFGYGLGIPWTKGFPVSNKQEMIDYCQKNEIELNWKAGDKLALNYTRWASLEHPVTEEKVWFNHATFFNFNSLDNTTRSLINEHIGEENAPYNTFYGDKTPIEEETIDLLKSLYKKHSVKVPYQKQDVLLIDNMLVAHGREPYIGQREICVTMTQNMGSK